jgi:tripeptide aminopeptidase
VRAEACDMEITVGTVSGGTSVNAIAAEARMAVDMRSNSTEELL